MNLDVETQWIEAALFLYLIMNKPITYRNDQWSVTVDGDLIAETYGVVIDRECLESFDLKTFWLSYEWFDINHFECAKLVSIEKTAA